MKGKMEGHKEIKVTMEDSQKEIKNSGRNPKEDGSQDRRKSNEEGGEPTGDKRKIREKSASNGRGALGNDARPRSRKRRNSRVKREMEDGRRNHNFKARNERQSCSSEYRSNADCTEKLYEVSDSCNEVSTGNKVSHPPLTERSHGVCIIGSSKRFAEHTAGQNNNINRGTPR